MSYAKAAPSPASETWTNANVYVINSNFLVGGGVTLTVSAGTVIKVEDFQYFNVWGTLILDGLRCRGSPSGLPSIRDDSVGGDTNGDGNGSQAQDPRRLAGFVH